LKRSQFKRDGFFACSGVAGRSCGAACSRLSFSDATTLPRFSVTGGVTVISWPVIFPVNHCAKALAVFALIFFRAQLFRLQFVDKTFAKINLALQIDRNADKPKQQQAFSPERLLNVLNQGSLRSLNTESSFSIVV
jgi:hypothetical protein